MKLKDKELHQILIAMAKLYGVIRSDEIYKVLKTYYPNILNKDIFAYLKKIADIARYDFFITEIEGKRNKLLLINSFIEDTTDKFVYQTRDEAPLYIPSTIEELLKYRDNSYLTKEEIKSYNELRTFLYENIVIKNNENKDKKIEMIIDKVHQFIKDGRVFMYEEYTDNFHRRICVPKSKYSEAQIICYTLVYYTKSFVYKGHSLNEVDLISRGQLAPNGSKTQEKKSKGKIYYYAFPQINIFPKKRFDSNVQIVKKIRA